MLKAIEESRHTVRRPVFVFFNIQTEKNELLPVATPVVRSAQGTDLKDLHAVPSVRHLSAASSAQMARHVSLPERQRKRWRGDGRF